MDQPIGIKSAASETNRKRGGLQINLLDVSSIYVISPICFYLNRLGNGNNDISSEEHFKNSKTSRGYNLDLQLYSSFVQIFEFYLVNQSL
jgi:hypothetical protein